jgi:hypothetical protein
MSLHINRFIDNLKAHEARAQRDFTMTMREAKDLHADITKLLLALQMLQENSQRDQVVEVVMSGGTFKST